MFGVMDKIADLSNRKPALFLAVVWKYPIGQRANKVGSAFASKALKTIGSYIYVLRVLLFHGGSIVFFTSLTS